MNLASAEARVNLLNELGQEFRGQLAQQEQRCAHEEGVAWAFNHGVHALEDLLAFVTKDVANGLLTDAEGAVAKTWLEKALANMRSEHQQTMNRLFVYKGRAENLRLTITTLKEKVDAEHAQLHALLETLPEEEG